MIKLIAINSFTSLSFKLNSEKPLPVLVFLFGGGFEKGDPSRDLHGPDYLMQKDIIFVTIGYRLGPLGKYYG